MLEHDVGQLPEKVVQEHQVTGSGRHAGSVRLDPDDVLGASPGGGRRPAPSQTRSAPRPRPAATGRRSRFVGRRPDDQQHVTGAGQEPQRSARSSPSRCTAGNARLPTITGWTNSTATWRPWAATPGRHAPHGGAGREPPAQRSAGESPGPRQRRQGRDRHGRLMVPSCVVSAAHPRRTRPRRPGPEPDRRRWGDEPVGQVTRKPRRLELGPGQPESSTFWNTPPLRAT